MTQTSWLSDSEKETLRAVAEAVLPAGRLLPGANAQTVERIEIFLSHLPVSYRGSFHTMLLALEAASMAQTFSRFSALPAAKRVEILESLQNLEATRLLTRGLMATVKFLHFATPEAYAAVGARYSVSPPAQKEKSRWLSQIINAKEETNDIELECDVVVVGTGAGGAPVAADLAQKGFAVLMLEEGQYHDRSEFNGRPVDALQNLYRHAGLTMSYGNTFIPIPVGRAVGGSTIINSGTCFRPPTDVLRAWASQGLTGLSPDQFAPYVDRVWSELQVAPSSKQALGKVAEHIANGCDALGWSHHPLDRNAPGCDGQGLCCFGCPTEAKRSTNVTWIPKALDRGAQLLTGVKVDRVLVKNDRAYGVEGHTRLSDGRTLRVTVRASAVVLACGSLHTPSLLLRQGICNTSGELGKNLSIHPASSAIAIMPESFEGWNTVPQGYCINEFHHEGILFEGGTMPLEIVAPFLPGIGPGFMNLVEQFNKMLGFGFMVRDTSRGRIRPGPDGEPMITYWLNDTDLKKMRRGLALLSKVYFAAGAKEVITPVASVPRLRNAKEIEALENANFAARQIDMSAYHPLGTAKLGVDPFHSVVNPDHETHDVLNLYVTDGSAVPGPPGVNPQVTIMSFSLRAADKIARRLERLQAAAELQPLNCTK